MSLLADDSILQKCLFFTANRLANVLRRIVNDVYSETGIAAPYVYLLIVVNQYPGITITELSEKLDISPSTCTRFVDALVKQGILKKEQKWKTVHVDLTDYGREKTESIDAGIAKFREKCTQIISSEEYDELAKAMSRTADKFDRRQK